MELKIKVCTDDRCKIVVKDITEVGGSGYLPESATTSVKNRFKYSDTVSIFVLQHNKVEESELKTPIYYKHDDVMKPVVLNVSFDGWFNAFHVVLPSQEWFERELNKTTGSSLFLYDVVYFSDGNYIFKYIDGKISSVELSEVLERNIEGTTISKIDKDYVSICFLKKCYISLCQQIFNGRGFNECWNKNNLDSELIYRRDLVWMSINVIKYLVQFNQLAEAQRIIETIGGCNGLCKTEFRQLTNHGCGCGK